MEKKPTIFGATHVESSGLYTAEMLKSFFAHTELGSGDKFFIVDNDSTLDNFFSAPVESIYPALIKVKPESPRSFSENANYFANEALKVEGHLFLLNNDLIFSPGWLTPFNSDLHAIQAPVCNMQHRYKAGDLALDLSMKLHQYLGKENEFLAIAAAHQKQVRGLRLAHSFPYYCVKIPYSVLSTVGLFDEQFAPYGWEDTDYTVRACIKGVPLFFQLGSFILHFYGKSTWGVGDIDLKDANKGDSECERKFLEKWGQRIAKLFAYHAPDAMNEIEARLTSARFGAFQAYIKDSLQKPADSAAAATGS